MNVNTFMRESIRTIDICSTNSSEIFHPRIEEMDQRHGEFICGFFVWDHPNKLNQILILLLGIIASDLST